MKAEAEVVPRPPSHAQDWAWAAAGMPKKMRAIRVLLSGRSGNILFQYAAGRALASRLGVGLLLDSSLIPGSTWKVSSNLLLMPLGAEHRRDPTPCTRWFHRVLRRLPRELLGEPIYREPPADHRFNPKVLQLSPGSTLLGYFQSPLYFGSLLESLREQFEPTRWPLPQSLSDAGRPIGEPGSVAVHCRRGDYVGNPTFDILGPGYFLQAMDEMRARLPGCRFHVFSDAPVWCREQFTAEDVVIESELGRDDNPLVDWYLMSRAHHHILSNSSYAWWGAWFGQKPGQMVLVPPVWLKGVVAPVREKCLPHWEIFEPRGGLL